MRKNIFVDGRVFDTEYQGTRTYIQNLYNIIDEIGDLEIFIASKNPDHTSIFFPNSKNIKFLTYQSDSKLKRVLVDIPGLIEKHKIKNAHFQYVISPLRRTRQIVTIHDILFKDFPNEFSAGYKAVKGLTFYVSAKKADIITTVSEYSKLAIHKHFDIPLDKIHVVANGVGDFYFEPYDKEKAKEAVFSKFGIKDYLLYVSRIEPRKNQLDLLKSYLDLKLYERGKQLVFVGKQSIAVKELDTIVNGLSAEMKKNIFFINNIPDIDLRLIYQGADLFAYPSKAEGFGIPPLEAAALGVPVICSNATAMKEYDFFGDNHIAPTEEAISQSILKNISNLNTPDTNDIKRIVKDLYSWDHSAQILNKLILGKH